MAAASTLPRFMVLYAKTAEKYVNYIYEAGPPRNEPRILAADSDQVSNPLLKFEVVPSTVHSSMVHIRCCYNNKFIAMTGANLTLLHASSDNPVDDLSSWSSTLFQPEFLTGEEPAGLVRLLHVQSRCYVQWEDDTAHMYYRCIRLLSPAPVLPNSQNVFKPIDWDTIVTLPRHVAFKGNNGRYLGLLADQTGAALRFAIDDEGDKSIANEVVALYDASFRFKNVSLGKFWDRHADTGFIWADNNEDSADSGPSLFRAFKVSNNTIALKHLFSTWYCEIYTNSGIVDGLNPIGTSITEESARLELKELVASRRIRNIEFHLDDGWIYDQTENVVLNPGEEVFNDTTEAQTKEVQIPYTDLKTSTWQSSANSLKLGPVFEIQPDQMPQITDESVIELTTTPFQPSYVWGDTTKYEPKSAELHTVTLQPMSKVTLKLVATSVACDVPFSYTRYDVLDEADGAGDEEVHILEDGVYTGVNYINIKVEESPSK